MKAIFAALVLLTNLSAIAGSYSCQTTDQRCGMSRIAISEVKNGKLILTYDEGDEAYEEVVGVKGEDRDCSDKTTLSLCLKSETDKKLLLSQEDGVQGIRIVLNKETLVLQYEQTNLVPPFKVQFRERMCKFSCVKN